MIQAAITANGLDLVMIFSDSIHLSGLEDWMTQGTLRLE